MSFADAFAAIEKRGRCPQGGYGGTLMPFSNRAYENEPHPVRRLFRPPLNDFKRPQRNGRTAKQAPPEATNAESFYYIKQMNAKTPMVIVLTDGEEIRGWIEWYDRTCLKVNRPDAPNLLIQKHCIKYLFKQE